MLPGKFKILCSKWCIFMNSGYLHHSASFTVPHTHAKCISIPLYCMQINRELFHLASFGFPLCLTGQSPTLFQQIKAKSTSRSSIDYVMILSDKEREREREREREGAGAFTAHAKVKMQHVIPSFVPLRACVVMGC